MTGIMKQSGMKMKGNERMAKYEGFFIRKASFKQPGGLTGATSWEKSLRNHHTIKKTIISARANHTYLKDSA